MFDTNKLPEKQDVLLTNQPFVSIIIGNYNYGSFIKEAIDSAINQTYKNIEIIVVDDGSKDNSREIISRYGDQIIPVFKDNAGQPSVYNEGFAISKGEIICFLDSDDLFTVGKIEQVVQAFNASEEIGWCFHGIQLMDVNHNPLQASVTANYVTSQYDFRDRLVLGKIPPNLPPSSGLCFRRSVLSKILPMPTPTIIKNNDYYIKFMATALSKGIILRDELTYQRIHGNNATTLRKNCEYLIGREFIYTGLWIDENFPNFRKFANKMLGLGLSYHWVDGNNNLENIQAVKEYMSSSSWLEKIKINLIAFYYYLHYFKNNLLVQ